MLVIYFSHAPPSLPTLDPLPTPMRAILTCLLKTTLTAVLCCGVLMSPASNSLVQAEEPYQRFLAKLQSEQLFDLALLYLDDLEASGELGAEFASELELERGLLTYQAGAVLSPTNPVRSSKFALRKPRRWRVPKRPTSPKLFGITPKRMSCLNRRSPNWLSGWRGSRELGSPPLTRVQSPFESEFSKI